MSDQRLGQDYGLRCVDTAVRRLCLLFLVLMFASIVDSAAAEVFRMDADTDFDTYDEGPDLDWPERIYLSAPAPNDRSVPDHSWLGNSCRELGTCYIEKFMKDNEVCRLFILKDGMQRLDLMVDSNGPCTRMNDYKNEGELERDGRYRLASVTKSLVSLLLGMTMEKDFGAGELDLNSSEALKNALSEAGLDYRSRATLAQLLQMRSGMHPWRENDDLQLNREIKVIENRKTGEIQDEPPFGRLKDKVRHYLAGKRFSNSLRHKYSSFDSTILGILVADRLKKAGKGESLAEGFDSLFWQPLEMTRNLQWKSDFSLNQPGFCCVKAHPHDIGKLGGFVLK